MGETRYHNDHDDEYWLFTDKNDATQRFELDKPRKDEKVFQLDI